MRQRRNLHGAAPKTTILATILILVITLQPEFVELRRRRHANAALITQFSSRMQEMRDNWSCNSPKERLVYIQDEKEHLICSSVTYTPKATPLFRCERATGCCPLNKQCLPATTEEVPILFEKMDHKLRRSFEFITFTNHTSCACQNSAESEK